MESSIQILINGDVQRAPVALYDFLQNNSQSFEFPELSRSNCREALWKSLYNLLASSQQSHIHHDCLSAVRILSRDKTNLNELVTEEWLHTLLYHSGLKGEKKLDKQNDFETALEALKCLCNVIFNSTVARAIFCKNGSFEDIIKRLRTYRDAKVPTEIKYFDMKILFLITALCAEVRPKLKDELHGLTYLIETLDSVLKELHENDHNADMKGIDPPKLTDSQVNLSCEILKALFNLSIPPNMHDTIDEEEEAHYLRLVVVLHDFLLVDVENDVKKSELISHIINLLTNMPDRCLTALMTPVQNGQQLSKQMQFEEQNMSAPYEIVRFLRRRFDSDHIVSAQHEMLSPVLSLLLKCARSNRAMRKYLRGQILPPLRDVHNRPEQGSAIRNCLCRLLTSPVSQVRDLSAEFLFVLCKENGRMVKYTGYGNAAGLFANRGLLGGKSDDTSNYSSESEDSETEEYSEYKHGINPVVGCYQPPRPNPTAHMTEEQKEYEAMKLVELMDNLTKRGVVKPCRIGEDGRPHPVEHVLQLQDGLADQHVHMDDTD